MKKMTLAFLIVAAPAYSHVPYVEGLDFQDTEAFQIKPPFEKSLAIYSRFNNANDQDRAVFVLTEADLKDEKAVVNDQGRPGRRIYFNTIVPACDAYAGILPAVALIGPEQSVLQAPEAKIDLPFNVAADQGVFYLKNTEQGPVFEEKFAGTRYFEQKTAEFIVTAPGRYELVVWEPKGLLGDYVLVFGKEEIFESQDIIQSVKRLKFLQEGMEIKDVQCRIQAKS